MKISIIVAASDNNVIGKDNVLLWHLPMDMEFFKSKTTSHCVLMGRNTWESIPKKYRPLPNRTNLVITNNKDLKLEGADVVHSLDQAIEKGREQGESEFFIIGGGQLYKQIIDQKLADHIYLTRVHSTFEGDAFFPCIKAEDWVVDEMKFIGKASKHQHSFTFFKFSRRN